VNAEVILVQPIHHTGLLPSAVTIAGTQAGLPRPGWTGLSTRWGRVWGRCRGASLAQGGPPGVSSERTPFSVDHPRPRVLVDRQKTPCGAADRVRCVRWPKKNCENVQVERTNQGPPSDVISETRISAIPSRQSVKRTKDEPTTVETSSGADVVKQAVESTGQADRDMEGEQSVSEEFRSKHDDTAEKPTRRLSTDDPLMTKLSTSSSPEFSQVDEGSCNQGRRVSWPSNPRIVSRHTSSETSGSRGGTTRDLVVSASKTSTLESHALGQPISVEVRGGQGQLGAQGNVKERKQRRQERRQDRKAAKTLSAILLAFVVTWTPYNVFTVIQTFCPTLIDPTVYAVGQ
jgi:hypothetical protein